MHDEQLSWDLWVPSIPSDPDDEESKTFEQIEQSAEELSYDLKQSAEELSYDPCVPFDTVLPLIGKEIHVPEEPVTCKHKVIFRSCKKGFVTYCNKCGKILSVRNRREK